MTISNAAGEQITLTHHRTEHVRHPSKHTYHWFDVDGKFIGVREHPETGAQIVDGECKLINISTPKNAYLGVLVNYVTDKMRSE